MLKKIESIRKKTKETRRRYAFWYALGFTLFVVVFWLSSVSSKLDFSVSVPSEEKQRLQGGFARSFSDFRSSFAGLFDKRDVVATSSQEETILSTSTKDTTSIADITSFFSSTSLDTKLTPELSTPAKRVLIGTTTTTQTGSEEN